VNSIIVALMLAARPEGVTALQLAEEAGVSPSQARRVLAGILGEQSSIDLGNLGAFEVEKRYPRPGKSGPPTHVYYLRKKHK
jgi:nucleoid DNA-binding protein